MKVTVLGKEHVSGTSKKTGKPFDANVLHLTYRKNGVEGTAVDSVWLDPASYSLMSISGGRDYDGLHQASIGCTTCLYPSTHGGFSVDRTTRFYVVLWNPREPLNKSRCQSAQRD